MNLRGSKGLQERTPIVELLCNESMEGGTKATPQLLG